MDLLGSGNRRVAVPVADIEHVLCLPKKDLYKKSGASVFLFVLARPALLGKTSLRVLLATPRVDNKQPHPLQDARTGEAATSGEAPAEEQVLMRKAIAGSLRLPVHEPDKALFSSSVGEASIKCYHQVCVTHGAWLAGRLTGCPLPARR